MGKETEKCGDADKLLNFTLRINKMIAEYERENNVQLISSSQGWLQYPEQYPEQKWLQLFSVVDSTSPIHCSGNYISVYGCK